MDALFKIPFLTSLILLTKFSAKNCESPTPPFTAPVYDCQFIDSLYDIQITRDPDVTYDCWGSQLTDKARYELFISFDKLRAHIADGTPGFNTSWLKLNWPLPIYGNVFRMHYHWIPEYIASRITLRGGAILNLTGDQKTDIFEEIRSLPYDKGTLEDFDAYEYTLKHMVTKMAPKDKLADRDNSPYKVVDIISWLLWLGAYMYMSPEGRVYDPEEEDVGTFIFFFPTTTYFGCDLRYNDSDTVPGVKRFFNNSLTCAFATKGTEKDREPKAGKLNQQSCRGSSPKGKLVYSPHGDGLPICVDREYDESRAVVDMPCQCYYNISPQTFADSKECPDDDPQSNPALENLVYPASFQYVRIHRQANDSIYIPRNPFTSSSNKYCAEVLSDMQFHMIPEYILRCYSAFAIFICCCIMFGALLLILITFNANRSSFLDSTRLSE